MNNGIHNTRLLAIAFASISLIATCSLDAMLQTTVRAARPRAVRSALSFATPPLRARSFSKMPHKSWYNHPDVQALKEVSGFNKPLLSAAKGIGAGFAYVGAVSSVGLEIGAYQAVLTSNDPFIDTLKTMMTFHMFALKTGYLPAAYGGIPGVVAYAGASALWKKDTQSKINESGLYKL